MSFRQAWRLIKEAGSAFSEDHASSMGAALAYYTVFSVAPLLLIVISVAGLVFGADAARGEIIEQLQGLMGEQGARVVQDLLQSVNQPKQGLFATAVGLITLLVGATTVFAELQDDLDRIWHAPARKARDGVMKLLRARLLSFGMILGIGFLLMVSLVLSAAIAALGKWWAPLFGHWELTAQVVNLVVGFALTTAVFAMIYKIMPRVHIDWRDVWIGALVTALLFSIGKLLIGLYLGRSSVTSGFGAAGSLVVLLLWVYYSAQIFLMGAEFTWVFAHDFGSRRGVDRPRGADADDALKAAADRPTAA
jgi:membrane protein